MSHNIFAPSAAKRWVLCPGSMSCAENYADIDAGEDAALGSGAHSFADRILRSNNRDAEFFLGEEAQIGTRVYTLDAEMAMYIQVYVDYCRNLAAKGQLFPEQALTITLDAEHATTGTSDCIVAEPRVLHTVDLKYGKGVKVYAHQNFQAMLYTKGALDLLEFFGPFDKLVAHIVQPRLDHIDTYEFTFDELKELCDKAAVAMERGQQIIFDPKTVKPEDFHPSDDACRWCRFVECPARAAVVAQTIGAEFESMPLLGAPQTDQITNAGLATKYQALPLIKQWVAAITAEVHRRVMAGAKVIGADGLPMKPVQGKPGDRKWDEAKRSEAEAALVMQFGDKAYVPATIVDPPAAEKLLKEKIKGRGAPKQREEIWDMTFKPAITRTPGKVTIVLGSDERPEYRGDATISEFSEGDDAE